MSSPLVSIVVTNYNYAQYVTECLESCAAQTYRNCETIIVDDCSTDYSASVIRGFIGKHPNMRLIVHDKNRGYSAAKNTAIRDARGKYIRLIDADDVLTPHAVEIALHHFLENPKLSLVHGIALRWYGGTDLRGYNKKTYIHAQGRMYRRDVYEKFGLYYEGLRSIADKEFVYRIGVHPDSPLKKLIKEKRIKDVVAWYRKHDNQMHRVRKLHPKFNERLEKAFKRRIRQLKREGITEENTPFLMPTCSISATSGMSFTEGADMVW